MLKTRVKVSSINNLTEARYFAAMGAEWIGFNFDTTSIRYLSSEVAKEISGWLAGPRFLGEFGKKDAEYINTVNQSLGFEIVQTDVDLVLDVLDNKISSVMHRLAIAPDTQMVNLEHFLEERTRWTSQFLLDFTEYSFSWNMLKKEKGLSPSLLKELCEAYDILVKFDFSKDNILEIIETLKPLGIDISGSDELQTGMQAFDEVGDIMELLETY